MVSTQPHAAVFATHTLSAGARLKVMRCAGVGPVVPFSYVGRQAFDAGVGINLDLNGSGISPVVRLTCVLTLRNPPRESMPRCVSCVVSTSALPVGQSTGSALNSADFASEFASQPACT